ncbi:hypothetical protein AC579_2850 [Pseudocercospora musae]|uniref:Uncharacterized protein n=1 Tax=Pseudocercospora musae TaxID=113226 RepID=A0A139I3L4_9PEZI|nr:hypothetical protein AC579_2850 [Pseudocercospora musae]KXT09299.1 hypothetical protein AC579_2850 [Pseudocercospora musae]
MITPWSSAVLYTSIKDHGLEKTLSGLKQDSITAADDYDATTTPPGLRSPRARCTVERNQHIMWIWSPQRPRRKVWKESPRALCLRS